MDISKFRHLCTIDDAPKFWDWIRNRGGVALWRSVNLSNPGKSWCTPVLNDKGELIQKPTWESASEPSEIFLSPDEIGVTKDEEVKRFHVAVRVKYFDGPFGIPRSLVCTPGGTRRIERAVAKAGNGAWYRFDYETQEAVIMAPVDIMTLTEWDKYFNEEGRNAR